MASFFDELNGRKPDVPPLEPIDLGTEQGKAITNNQKNLPGAEKLVGEANQFSRDQITDMLRSVFPGWDDAVGNISRNLVDLTGGKIPKDVQAESVNSDAAKALWGGYAGSGAHGNLVARDLGRTSLDLIGRGLSAAESWMKAAASLFEPSMLSVGSMFISPMQQGAFDVEERNSQFQRQWMQEQIDAMPAMWAQNLKEAFESILSVYSGTPVQHAGTLPIQGTSVGAGGGGFGNFYSGQNYYSPGAGEGGAAFDQGGPISDTDFGW